MPIKPNQFPKSTPFFLLYIFVITFLFFAFLSHLSPLSTLFPLPRQQLRHTQIIQTMSSADGWTTVAGSSSAHSAAADSKIAAESTRMKRLMRDLREIRRYPLPGIGVAPLEGNMLEWHCSVLATNLGDDVAIHFIMTFDDFPHKPPKIQICTPLPHANVHLESDHKHYICADFLETRPHGITQHQPYSGWTAGYTVSALLVQLQSFLLDKEFQYREDRITIPQAAEQAHAYTCEECGHDGATIEACKPPVAGIATPHSDGKVATSSCSSGATHDDDKVKVVLPRVLRMKQLADQQRLAAAKELAAKGNAPSNKKKTTVGKGFLTSLLLDTVDYNNNTKAASTLPAESDVKHNSRPQEAKVDLRAILNHAIEYNLSVSTQTQVKKPQTKPQITLATTASSHNVFAELETHDADTDDSDGWTVQTSKRDGRRKNRKSRQNNKAQPGAGTLPLEASLVPTILPEVGATTTLLSSRNYKRNRRRAEKRRRRRERLKARQDGQEKHAKQQQERQLRANAEQKAKSQQFVAMTPMGAMQISSHAIHMIGDDDRDNMCATTEASDSGTSFADEDIIVVAAAATAAAAAAAAEPIANKSKWSLSDSNDDDDDVENEDLLNTETPSTSIDKGNSTSNDTRCFINSVPYALMVEVMSYLEPADVANVACASKYTKSCAEDGYLWRRLFQRCQPNSQLTAESMRDWKYVYALEVNNILDNMCCFLTKATHEEAVLGIPLLATLNPVKKTYDYVYSTFDCISLDAYKTQKLRTTMWNDEFTHFLPLYVTEEHFAQALPTIRRTLLALCPDWRSSYFHPHMILDVIPRLLNTTIVLLCDQGIHASESAIQGFASVHRLFLALVKHFRLESEIDHRLGMFLKYESNRVKKVVPSLGNLLPLLYVSSKYSWQDLGPAYLSEQLDRGVLWMCKKFPDLANLTDSTWVHKYAVQSSAGPNDVESDTKEYYKNQKSASEQNPYTNVSVKMLQEKPDVAADIIRNDLAYDGLRITFRTTMMHVALIQHTMMTASTGQRRSLSDIADGYDYFFGQISNRERRQLQQHIKAVLTVESWPGYFRAIRMKLPSSQSALAATLRSSVRRSLKKRYHRPDTNFSNIHRSGVSKILLKGQSYTAPPDLTQITLEETWSYPNNLIYLDASCLAFDETGVHLAVCDYASVNCFAGAIVHSGDVINNGKKEGTHRMTVHLRQLPLEVHELYFTMTAFTTRLSDIKTPFISMMDSDHGMELCRFEPDANECSAFTALHMCRIVRVQRNVRNSAWRFDAIGQYGQGNAMDYRPIVMQIQDEFMPGKSGVGSLVLPY
jgi:ubiquitin-protein ligase/stress response protein SCP2